MKQFIFDNLKIAVVIIAGIFVALQFLDIYKTNVRNEAINGCYNISQYQASYQEGGRDVVIRQPQTYLYEQCLKDKGVLINPNR